MICYIVTCMAWFGQILSLRCDQHRSASDVECDIFGICHDESLTQKIRSDGKIEHE